MGTEQSVTRHRRGHGRVTLEDVAQVAGVTSITVSRYLREPGLVAIETAERVRAALRETGYVPNKQAGQLASGRSNLVAALVPSLARPDCAQAIQGLSDALQPAGLELLLASTGQSADREEDLLRSLLGWFPSAVVISGGEHTYGALKLLRGARAAGTPIIELGTCGASGEEDFLHVGVDHVAVGRAMAQHFVERGHRRVAYIEAARNGFGAARRGAAFAQLAQDAGTVVTRLQIDVADDPFDAGRRALNMMFAQCDATAVAFASDALACGALMEALSQGIAVPQRLALLGFGDEPIGRHMRPALSTVAWPINEVGHEAAKTLMAALRNQGAPECAMQWQLVMRGTT